jgi:4'-phosphopantetheinyl transferase
LIQIRHITSAISLGILNLKAFSEHYGLAVKRAQEQAGTLFVLRQLLGEPGAELNYTEQRKPYLAGRPEHISISHSHDKLVIILNREKNTGVDIELVRDKVLTVRHKFLNEAEALFAGTDVEKLISIWAAKESMYKYHGLKGLDFKTNISVEDFDGTVIFGKIETGVFKGKFLLIREKIDGYMLVYILDEI